MSIAWPDTWKPIDGGFFLDNPSRGGGPGIDGREQTVASMGMRWRAQFRFAVRTREQVLDGRALFGLLLGRANAVALPVFDGLRAPWPTLYGERLHPGRTREKELDGTIYEDDEIPSRSAINATVSGLTALGATSIVVAVTQGGTPRSGQYFGVGERAHLITGVAGGSTPYTLTFVPPLRAAVANGATVLFADPVCAMKQVADDQGLKTLQLLRFGDLTLDFVEDF